MRCPGTASAPRGAPVGRSPLSLVFTVGWNKATPGTTKESDGGDEFVCALTGLGMTEAAKRFAAVNADLAETGVGSITVGLAGLHADDSLERVLARADEALYAERERDQGR